MATTNADVIAGQYEKVRPKLQALVEQTTGIGKYFKKASEAHKISAWSQALNSGQTLSAFRVPVMRYEGGDYATFDLNEGDMGGGSMLREDFMSFGYFPDRVAIQVNKLAMDATATNEQAVVNTWRFHVKNAIKTYQVYYDTVIHQDGTGVLATGAGTGSPANTNPVYNLEPNFGAQLLRLNQPVDVWDAALANNKGTLRVASFNHQTKTATLTGTVTGAGAVNTDRIAISGMSGTLAVGSNRNGLYTFANSATSGFTGGLDRAVVTEIVTPNVAAGGAALTPAFGMLLNDLRVQRRDPEALSSTVGIAHMAQRAAWYLQGISISEWKRGNKDKMIDITPSDLGQDDDFEFCGITHKVDKKQRRDRIDWIVPDTFCRALLQDADFYKSPEGKMFFELRGSVGIKAGFLMYFYGTDQLVCVDPGSLGMITGLALPAGM